VSNCLEVHSTETHQLGMGSTEKNLTYNNVVETKAMQRKVVIKNILPGCGKECKRNHHLPSVYCHAAKRDK
jgi:hypothetical protein